jgi:hypothetical protein
MPSDVGPRVLNPPLDVHHHVSGVAFIGVAAVVLGQEPELDDEVSRQILSLDQMTGRAARNVALRIF